MSTLNHFFEKNNVRPKLYGRPTIAYLASEA